MSASYPLFNRLRKKLWNQALEDNGFIKGKHVWYRYRGKHVHGLALQTGSLGFTGNVYFTFEFLSKNRADEFDPATAHELDFLIFERIAPFRLRCDYWGDREGNEQSIRADLDFFRVTGLEVLDESSRRWPKLADFVSEIDRRLPLDGNDCSPQAKAEYEEIHNWKRPLSEYPSLFKFYSARRIEYLTYIHDYVHKVPYPWQLANGLECSLAYLYFHEGRFEEALKYANLWLSDESLGGDWVLRMRKHRDQLVALISENDPERKFLPG